MLGVRWLVLNAHTVIKQLFKCSDICGYHLFAYPTLDLFNHNAGIICTTNSNVAKYHNIWNVTSSRLLYDIRYSFVTMSHVIGTVISSLFGLVTVGA